MIEVYSEEGRASAGSSGILWSQVTVNRYRPKVGASRDTKATGVLVLLVWDTELFVMLLTLWMPGQRIYLLTRKGSL